MGFIEIDYGLWMKDLGRCTKLYRDYRKKERASYAYQMSRRLPVERFQEFKAIEKIERFIENHGEQNG